MEKSKSNEKLLLNPSDHLANERTFLAWIRTSIALMGFGFVVVKFALFIKQISLVLNKPGMVTAPKGYSQETGIFLVATGIIMAIYAYIRYRITEKQLLDDAYKPSYLLAGLVTVLILIAGAVLVIFLIPNLIS
jgi:putative membrane protein